MNYHLFFTENALNQLKGYDSLQVSILLGWLTKNLEGTNTPRSLGKPLKNTLFGQYIFTFGIFRILTIIEDKKIIILAVNC